MYFCSISYNISSSISDFISGLFFSLVSLAKDSSILFIFSKNQLLVLLIFSIVLLVSILFLIFIIYFILLTLYFVSSLFSSFFWCKLKFFFFEIVLVSWSRLIFLRASLLEPLLLHRFWYVVFPLSQSMFLFLYWYFSLTQWLFSSLLLNIHIFVIFTVFF